LSAVAAAASHLEAAAIAAEPATDSEEVAMLAAAGRLAAAASDGDGDGVGDVSAGDAAPAAMAVEGPEGFMFADSSPQHGGEYDSDDSSDSSGSSSSGSSSGSSGSSSSSGSNTSGDGVGGGGGGDLLYGPQPGAIVDDLPRSPFQRMRSCEVPDVGS